MLIWKHHTGAADLLAAHPWCESPISPHPKKCSVGVRSGDCGGYSSIVNSLSCSRNQFEMIWALWHGALSCWKWSERDGHGQQQYFSKSWHLNNAQQVLSGPKCAKKISPKPLHQQQPEPLIQGRMDPCFHVVTPNSDPAIWKSQKKSGLIGPGNLFSIFYCQFWWSCTNCSLSFLFLADRSGTCCGLLLVWCVVLSEILLCISWL